MEKERETGLRSRGFRVFSLDNSGALVYTGLMRKAFPFFAAILILAILALSGCPFDKDDKPVNIPGSDDDWPSYAAKTAWVSEVKQGKNPRMALDGDYIYDYQDTDTGYMTLTKIDAQTGNMMWNTSESFPSTSYTILFYGDYVLTTTSRNWVYFFNKETGTLAAKIHPIENSTAADIDHAIVDGHYLYFIYTYAARGKGKLMRLDLTQITYSTPSTEQTIAGELLYDSTTDNLNDYPLVHEGIVYAHTMVGGYTNDTTHIAAIDVRGNEPQPLWEKPITYKDNQHYILGIMENGLLAHENTLYSLRDETHSAFNRLTGDVIWEVPIKYSETEHSNGKSALSEPAVYYKDKLYYTSYSGKISADSDPTKLRNVHCINAKTGKPVWNDAPEPYMEVLGVNPVIHKGKMYVTYTGGFCVYDPDTGKRLGRDKDFHGFGSGSTNLLYGDYLITYRDNKIVAVNLD